MNALRLGFAVMAIALPGVVELAAQDNKEPMPTGLATHKVTYIDLQVKVVERGTLEAKESRDVKCQVKPGSRGAPKIKWLVDNGSLVQKGDLVVEIDDSYLQDRAESQKIARDAAVADLESAELDSKLQPQKAELDVKHAEYRLESAEDELKKLEEGGGELMRKDIKSRLAMAEADVELWRARVALAEKELKDGKTTEGLVKAKRQKQEAAAAVVETVKSELEVVEKYDLPVRRKELKARIETAKGELEMEKKRGESTVNTAKASLLSKRAIRDQQEAMYKDVLEQVKKCKIYTPRSGLVAYHVPAPTQAGTAASVIAKGEPVQYGQRLLTVGDPSHFVASVRIHDALVNHLKPGVAATVRVETFPDRALKAQVKGTAAVAAAPEGSSPDTKVYQVSVEIDDKVEKLRLKPGLSALVTITTDAKAEHVLAVPVVAVILPKEKGKRPSCLVMTSDGLEDREIELGLNDSKMVEIKSGLKEGDLVAVDRRVLPEEKRDPPEDRGRTPPK
jgi:multidrug efflux pump subunit AcrA (membrane-fusion protein)